MKCEQLPEENGEDPIKIENILGKKICKKYMKQQSKRVPVYDEISQKWVCENDKNITYKPCGKLDEINELSSHYYMINCIRDDLECPINGFEIVPKIRDKK